MTRPAAEPRLTAKLVDTLYVEAMVLADEARAYFEDHGAEERDELEPKVRVGYAIESLKVTTRIMHVIAWLLSRRAIEAGELSRSEADDEKRRLGHAGKSDPAVTAKLPFGARELIASSEDLYARVKRLDEDLVAPRSAPSPARTLMGRLERAF